MGSGRPGRYLKSFLEAVRFILTQYGPVASVTKIIDVFFVFKLESKNMFIRLYL